MVGRQASKGRLLALQRRLWRATFLATCGVSGPILTTSAAAAETSGLRQVAKDPLPPASSHSTGKATHKHHSEVAVATTTRDEGGTKAEFRVYAPVSDGPIGTGKRSLQNLRLLQVRVGEARLDAHGKRTAGTRGATATAVAVAAAVHSTGTTHGKAKGVMSASSGEHRRGGAGNQGNPHPHTNAKSSGDENPDDDPLGLKPFSIHGKRADPKEELLFGMPKLAWALICDVLAMFLVILCIPLVLTCSKRRPPGQGIFSSAPEPILYERYNDVEWPAPETSSSYMTPGTPGPGVHY